MRSLDDTYNALGMKDHPEGSKKLDVAAIENPELVRTVEDRLANLAAITGREKGKNPAVSDVDDSDEPTPDVDDDVDVVEDKKADEVVVDKDSTPDAGQEKEKEGIPDAYVRAAVHSGWKEEDIEELTKTNPVMARKTFENLYNSTNKASREWAALGRAKRDTEIRRPEPSNEGNKLGYSDLDIASLKKEFDIDPGFEKVLEKVNERDRKLVDALNNLSVNKNVQDTSRVEQAVRNNNVAAEAAAEQQINGFFSSDPMRPYDKFYGKLNFGESWDDLPAGQKRNRYAVFTTADQMLAGASMQGYQMDLVEALEKAHLLVTDGMREKTIRSEIKNTSTKRKNSMLMKPSDGKGKGPKGGRPKTRNDLETKVAQRLSKVYGSR